MRTLFISFVIFLSGAIASATYAQVQVESGKTVEKKIEQLKKKKQEIAEKEKALLKEEVKKINEQLKNEEITYEEAERLKKEAAQKRALNIKNQQDIIDANIALLERNQDEEYYVAVSYGEEEDWKEGGYKDTIQTVSYPYIAFGLNNAIIEGQTLEESPYKIWGSRFFEIGLEFNTTLTKSGFFRLKYGIAWQSNGLKPENNLYFVDEGNQTHLNEFGFELEKAKLSMNNLVIPIHFEFGPSTLSEGVNY
ncbi:MAG TPA: hypothetical protein VFI78_07990, partial [Salinimicrobium sp.]|nr:hypothetical protein [Salinimicrobium sp.]